MNSPSRDTSAPVEHIADEPAADYGALLLDELAVISNCAISALRLMTLAPHKRDRVIVEDDGTIIVPADTPKEPRA